jgi:putative zinc finger/helix-turn-helix YgiT family protein
MNPQYGQLFPLPNDRDERCPSCDCSNIETVEIERTLPYGEGEQAVELPVTVPLRRCCKCGFEFLDVEAEERQHEAVCRHLGVMTPSEIRSVRQATGNLSRGEFARITRLGEATLGRWERGELIQNAANDQLLYLLTFCENIIRLRERAERGTPSAGLPKSPSPSFRVIQITDDLRERAAKFSLTRTGAA